MRSRLPLWLGLLLLVGAARFVYALSASNQGWSGVTYMEVVYSGHDRPALLAGERPGAERRWGPLFTIFMGAARRLIPSTSGFRLTTRVTLTAIYLLTVYLVSGLAGGRSASASPGPLIRRALLIFLCLQSTAAIYAIANGMGEVVSAFFVIANLHYFLRRQYLPAAFLMVFCVYFKLFPIVFLFPYFLFALLSREHRPYCGYLVLSGLALAFLALPFAGWEYGFLYPFSMIRDVVADPRVVPMRSKEVFGLLFLVSRLLSSFSVHEVAAAAAQTRILTSTFTTLLLASTAAIAVALARYEGVWNADAGRRGMALIAFQAAIGFCIVLFALDVSIAHLLPIMVSLYAPLWLIENPLFTPRKDAFVWVTLAVFVVGLVLVGNLIPLSLVLKGLPLARLDALAGNAPADLIPLEKYLWYQIPLVGVACIGLSCGGAFIEAWRNRASTIGAAG